MVPETLEIVAEKRLYVYDAMEVLFDKVVEGHTEGLVKTQSELDIFKNSGT